MTSIRTKTEFACALGGAVFKPYLLGKQIKVETITADRFYPVEFGSDGEMTSAVFAEQYTSGKTYYTRLEYLHVTRRSRYLIMTRQTV